MSIGRILVPASRSRTPEAASCREAAAWRNGRPRGQWYTRREATDE